MGKPTLAGALPLVLRNEKQKLKKKKREKKEIRKLVFSNIYQTRGRLWRSLKTEVKKERVKKWALSFFLKMECNWKQHAAKGQGQE